MRLLFDHSTGLVKIKRQEYLINDLKSFLIKRYPSLVAKFYVKGIHQCGQSIERKSKREGSKLYVETLIHRNGKTIITYDWTEIFRRAQRTVLPLEEFITYKCLHETRRH